MTLTHVCIKEGSRWRRITEEEAEREYPCGTVSAWEGIFKCELCGQNVIFTADSDYKRRYFKHSRGDLVKDCPERLEQSSQSSDPLEFKAGVYDLPLRIRICSDTHFRLELGFLQVPISLLRNERKIRIYI